jgi:hypothetical protein
VLWIFILGMTFQGCFSPPCRPVTSGLDLEFFIDKGHQQYELRISNKLSEDVNISLAGDIPLVSVWVARDGKKSKFVPENEWDAVFGDLSRIGKVVYPQKKIKPGEAVVFFLFPKEMLLYDSKRQTLEEFLKLEKVESISVKLSYRGGSGRSIAGELSAIGVVKE